VASVPGFFQHERAIVESHSIGRGTRVWAMAHILPGAVIGEDCNICDHVFIENDVVIGNRVTVKCGVQLWDGIYIDDDVFIGPNATFTNDPFPRSKQRPDSPLRTQIRRGASIGANATILPGLTIGERAMIGAGAVVTRNVPPLAIVSGNPARIVGYDGADRVPLAVINGAPSQAPARTGAAATRVPGVTLQRLPSAADMRGQLAVAEIGKQVPFDVKRIFMVYGVPGREVRGEHAHKNLHQFLVCVHGECSVVADDGEHRQEFLLNDPTLALHIPPRIWAVQYKHAHDAVLIVFASDFYDPSDYIRDYSEFLQMVGKSHA
jgi:UDP-2-acetamido-3-amino-2,3-dideoxy-glucuronate N-acetyltransferase